MLPMDYVGDAASRLADPMVKIVHMFTLLGMEQLTGHQLPRSQGCASR
jgi:hypothetical protein